MNHTVLGSLILAAACIPALAQTKAAPAAAAKAAVTAVKMKPGLWEITTINETAGSTAKRTVTMRACYGAEDVGNVQRIVPQQREFGMKCETRDAKQHGAQAIWRVACTGKDSSLNGAGKMTLEPDAFTGRAELERKAAGAKAVKVEQHVSGKWIDLCK